MDHEQHIGRDRELGDKLRALDAPVDPAVVTALRQRIMVAAAPMLAARAKWQRRKSWLDETSAFGRVAIPFSIAAALLAMVLVRQMPVVAPTVDMSQTLAYNLVGDTLSTELITEQMLLPDNADMVLLGFSEYEDRQ